MDTTAIIQFIGIVLFSSAVPEDPGVHAILPTINHGTHAAHRLTHGDANRSQTSSSGTQLSPGVEDHVAAILFRKDDVLARSGDFASEGTLRSRWAYVELEGEQVQFLTNAANEQPRIPENLPRAARPQECPTVDTDARLRAEFHGPAYRGAAAVVDIPAGKLDVCAKRTTDEAEALLRVDTTLLMNTDGVLVIAAKKPNETTAKTITLAGNAIVYVVNVPPHYVFTGTYSEKTLMSDPHWLAYTAMIDTDCPTRPEEPAVRTTCDLSAINSAWKQAQNNPPTDVLMMVNSECSNTQWP